MKINFLGSFEHHSVNQTNPKPYLKRDGKVKANELPLNLTLNITLYITIKLNLLVKLTLNLTFNLTITVYFNLTLHLNL